VEASLRVEHLVKRFKTVTAVDDVSFDVRNGSIFGLLGRNGAGKTTTLEICVGLGVATSGTVRVLGLDPSRTSDLAKLRPRIGVQLQSTSLPERAKVGEILDLYAAFYGVKPSTAELAGRVGMSDKLDRFIGKLSGGEQQRVALALALLHDPDILFLDEPTAGMDAFGRRILWGEIDRLRTESKTVVLTTHYIEEAERLCDEICVVKNGQIVARDTPAGLVATYGGDASINFRADGFMPDDGLLALGTWQREGMGWRVLVHHEPGRVLGTIAAAVVNAGVSLDALDLRKPTLEVVLILALGAATFVALGTTIGAVVKSTESANNIASVLTVPLAFVSDAYIPIDRFPAWLATPLHYLPSTQFIDAFRGIAMHGDSLAHYGAWIVTLLAWTAAGTLVSARTFRWV
jgi:ABC-2 type transport system ATP-binding protein